MLVGWRRSPFTLQALTQIQEMTSPSCRKSWRYSYRCWSRSFMAEKLHAEMLRIAARIVSG